MTDPVPEDFRELLDLLTDVLLRLAALEDRVEGLS